MDVKKDKHGNPYIKDIDNNETDGYLDRKESFCPFSDKRCGQTQRNCELYLDGLNMCSIRAYCISNTDSKKAEIGSTKLSLIVTIV